jgi:hypothetical protein
MRYEGNFERMHLENPDLNYCSELYRWVEILTQHERTYMKMRWRRPSPTNLSWYLRVYCTLEQNLPDPLHYGNDTS